MKLRIKSTSIVFRLSLGELFYIKQERFLEDQVINCSVNFVYGVYVSNKVKQLALNSQQGFRLLVPQNELHQMDYQHGLFSVEGNLIYGLELDTGRCHTVRP